MTRNQQLIHDIIRDLIADVRSAERDGLTEYATTCRRTLSALWKRRHTVRLDQYGWPVGIDWATRSPGSTDPGDRTREEDKAMTHDPTAACCACLNVKYDPIRLEGPSAGMLRERWRCALCGAVFVRYPSNAATAGADMAPAAKTPAVRGLDHWIGRLEAPTVTGCMDKDETDVALRDRDRRAQLTILKIARARAWAVEREWLAKIRRAVEGLRQHVVDIDGHESLDRVLALLGGPESGPGTDTKAGE